MQQAWYLFAVQFNVVAVLKEYTRSERRRNLFRVVAVLAATILSWGFAEIVILLSGINNDYRESGASILLLQPGGPTELSDCGHVPFGTIRTRYPTNPRGLFNFD